MENNTNNSEKKGLNSISFFIPAFNCADTIIESVNSIIDTNFNDGDEIIITNDGSTDNTERVINNLANKHPFVKIINHQRNRGGAAARNTAIENAKHEILFCLDSDNILAPNSISPLKKYLIEKNADCAIFQKIYFFKDNIEVLHKKIEYVGGLVTLEYCFSENDTPISSGNYMFTKTSWEKAGGYPEENWLDTWGFGVRQLFAGAKMYTLPDTFYYHRRGHESYTIREVRKGKTSLNALQILIPYFHLLSNQSENYIMSKRSRYTWFFNLKNKPLKLARSKRNIKNKNISLRNVLLKLLSHVKNFIN
jgi:glycosyltransferase involved in cell wall biosynthesis